MSLADELSKLGYLHQTGKLSDAEFSRAKEKLLSSLGSEASSLLVTQSQPLLCRSICDRWLGGVCGGLARYSNSESWIWRLLFVGFVCIFGTGFIFYLLAWIFIPEEGSY